MTPRTAQRGTSRVVPVVVSAGLAVGVFCGLMFGLGTGKDEASAAPSTKTVGAKKDKGATQDVDTTPPDVTPPRSVTDGTHAPTKPVVAKGSAGSAAPNPAADHPAAADHPVTDPAGAGSAEPAVKTVKITVEIKPDSAAQLAKITVDGKEAPHAQLDLDLGAAPKKNVKVVVKAIGFKDLEQTVEIEAGKDTKVQVELARKRIGNALPRPEGTGGKKPAGAGGKKPGGGLIDI